MSKYITNLNLPLLQYSLCSIGDLITPSTNDTLATGYLSHQIGLVNQNDFPLQLGLKLQYLRMIFWRLEWHKLRPRLPGPLTKMYPATDSLHLVTSHVLQVSTRFKYIRTSCHLCGVPTSCNVALCPLCPPGPKASHLTPTPVMSYHPTTRHTFQNDR